MLVGIIISFLILVGLVGTVSFYQFQNLEHISTTVPKTIQTITQPSADVMRMSAQQGCDLNSDALCNETDEALFKQRLGRCKVDFKDTVDVLADADADGCLTESDQKLLFDN